MWNNHEIFKPEAEVQVLIRTRVKEDELNAALNYFNDAFKNSPTISGAGTYDCQVKVIGTKAEIDVFTNDYNIYAVGTVL